LGGGGGGERGRVVIGGGKKRELFNYLGGRRTMGLFVKYSVNVLSV
jgi:hypothetical protein